MLAAAVELFSQRGFHGTSTRALSEQAGMGLASMYHYFPSKYDMLVRILDDVMTGLFSACQSALVRASDDPADRLDAIVRAHCDFHTYRQKESFITNTEMRALTETDRRQHIAARDRHQRMFDAVVLDGVERGAFLTPYPVEASRAIVTMTTAVANWFRPKGPLSPAEVADRYAILALAQVEAVPPARTRAGRPDEKKEA